LVGCAATDRATSRAKRSLVKCGRDARRCDDTRVARRISAEGKLVKPGRQTSNAEGFVRDGAGSLAVHVIATFSMVGKAARTK